MLPCLHILKFRVSEFCQTRDPSILYPIAAYQRARQFASPNDHCSVTPNSARYPPDKRPSFQKLGVPCPFFFPWGELVHQWSSIHSGNVGSAHATADLAKPTFYVLRSRKVLRRLVEAFPKECRRRKGPRSDPAKDFSAVHAAAREANVDLSRALVCVAVTSLSKGVPSRFDSICMPSDDDVITFKDRRNALLGMPQSPCESLHKVPRKKTGKKKNKKVPRPTVEELLARPPVEDVVDCCSRRLVGYVVSGDYCFTSASGRGVGYCSLLGLLGLLEASTHGAGPLVLFRHQHSLQYRFASVQVLPEC